MNKISLIFLESRCDQKLHKVLLSNMLIYEEVWWELCDGDKIIYSNQKKSIAAWRDRDEVFVKKFYLIYLS